MQYVSRALARRTFWIPTGIIIAGGLGACVFWTLPNMTDFSLVLAQFSDLWQIPSNRLPIIAVIVKVLSPLFLMTMIGIVVWIWYLVREIRARHLSTHVREQEAGTGSTDDARLPDPVAPIPEPLETIRPASPAQAETSEASLITIRLLGEIMVLINVAGKKPFAVKLASNLKKLEMLAYIACKQGKPVDRDKLLEEVFGWRLQDEEATVDKLGQSFDTHKKLLRKDLRRAVEQINTQAGEEAIDVSLEPFARTGAGFWQLANICHVEDLATADACSKVIALARHEGRLTETIPEEVKQACEQILAVYKGDFLAHLIASYPEEFGAWRGKASWVRKPFTRYRDVYLEALWLLGESHAKRSEQDQNPEWAGKAADFFKDYALYACNSKLDLKLFWQGQTVGERVGMSERALRRCVVLLGALGKTDEVHRVWSEYSLKMRTISEGRWKASQDTLSDVEAAQSNTSAHRFPQGLDKQAV
jgi:hypothetical protein